MDSINKNQPLLMKVAKYISNNRVPLNIILCASMPTPFYWTLKEDLILIVVLAENGFNNFESVKDHIRKYSIDSKVPINDKMIPPNDWLSNRRDLLINEINEMVIPTDFDPNYYEIHKPDSIILYYGDQFKKLACDMKNLDESERIEIMTKYQIKKLLFFIGHYGIRPPKSFYKSNFDHKNEDDIYKVYEYVIDDIRDKSKMLNIAITSVVQFVCSLLIKCNSFINELNYNTEILTNMIHFSKQNEESYEYDKIIKSIPNSVIYYIAQHLLFFSRLREIVSVLPEDFITKLLKEKKFTWKQAPNWWKPELDEFMIKFTIKYGFHHTIELSKQLCKKLKSTSFKFMVNYEDLKSNERLRFPFPTLKRLSLYEFDFLYSFDARMNRISQILDLILENKNEISIKQNKFSSFLSTFYNTTQSPELKPTLDQTSTPKQSLNQAPNSKPTLDQVPEPKQTLNQEPASKPTLNQASTEKQTSKTDQNKMQSPISKPNQAQDSLFSTSTHSKTQNPILQKQNPTQITSPKPMQTETQNQSTISAQNQNQSSTQTQNLASNLNKTQNDGHLFHPQTQDSISKQNQFHSPILLTPNQNKTQTPTSNQTQNPTQSSIFKSPTQNQNSIPKPSPVLQPPTSTSTSTSTTTNQNQTSTPSKLNQSPNLLPQNQNQPSAPSKLNQSPNLLPQNQIQKPNENQPQNPILQNQTQSKQPQRTILQNQAQNSTPKPVQTQPSASPSTNDAQRQRLEDLTNRIINQSQHQAQNQPQLSPNIQNKAQNPNQAHPQLQNPQLNQNQNQIHQPKYDLTQQEVDEAFNKAREMYNSIPKTKEEMMNKNIDDPFFIMLAEAPREKIINIFPISRPVANFPIGIDESLISEEELKNLRALSQVNSKAATEISNQPANTVFIKNTEYQRLQAARSQAIQQQQQQQRTPQQQQQQRTVQQQQQQVQQQQQRAPQQQQPAPPRTVQQQPPTPPRNVPQPQVAPQNLQYLQQQQQQQFLQQQEQQKRIAEQQKQQQILQQQQQARLEQQQRIAEQQRQQQNLEMQQQILQQQRLIEQRIQEQQRLKQQQQQQQQQPFVSPASSQSSLFTNKNSKEQLNKQKAPQLTKGSEPTPKPPQPQPQPSSSSSKPKSASSSGDDQIPINLKNGFTIARIPNNSGFVVKLLQSGEKSVSSDLDDFDDSCPPNSIIVSLKAKMASPGKAKFKVKWRAFDSNGSEQFLLTKSKNLDEAFNTFKEQIELLKNKPTNKDLPEIKGTALNFFGIKMCVSAEELYSAIASL